MGLPLCDHQVTTPFQTRPCEWAGVANVIVCSETWQIVYLNSFDLYSFTSVSVAHLLYL